MKRYAVVAAVAAALLVIVVGGGGCLLWGATRDFVTVENAAGRRIEDIELECGGQRRRIEVLAHGESRTVIFTQSAGAAINFRFPGRRGGGREARQEVGYLVALGARLRYRILPDDTVVRAAGR